MDALKKIALELHVSTDFLLFEAHERGPSDDLALKLEAVSQMPEDEQMVIREVLESLIIKYQSRRWDSGRQAAKELLGSLILKHTANRLSAGTG